MVFRWHHDQVVGDMADAGRDSLVSSGKNTSKRVGWMVGNHRHWETTQILCLLSSFKAGGPRGVGGTRGALDGGGMRAQAEEIAAAHPPEPANAVESPEVTS